MVAFLVAPLTVIWLAGSALILVLAFNFGYAHALQDGGRPTRRMLGDRWVVRFLAFGLLLPLLVAIVLWLFDYNRNLQIWDFTVNETSSLLIGAAALFILIICSSAIDWYYIRPRIDGAVCAPPCRSSGSDTWKGPTRWWYLHRGLATLAYMAYALVVALVVMLMLVREHPAAAGVIGGVGGIAGLLLIFAGNYRAQLPTVAQFVLSPGYCLGDDLTYEAGKWGGRGFVLHVAVPVTKLVPLDENGQPSGPAFVERKNSDLNEADLTPRHTIACEGGCAHLNPQCLADLPRLDQRRHLLIF
jgi:hypothetical protein